MCCSTCCRLHRTHTTSHFSILVTRPCTTKCMMPKYPQGGQVGKAGRHHSRQACLAARRSPQTPRSCLMSPSGRWGPMTQRPCEPRPYTFQNPWACCSRPSSIISSVCSHPLSAASLTAARGAFSQLAPGVRGLRRRPENMLHRPENIQGGG